MSLFPVLYEAVINILVYFACIVHIITAPAKDRLKVIITIIGFFALLFLFPNDFFLVQTLIAAWLVVTGVPLIVSRNVMLALVIIAAVLTIAMPYFFFVSFVIYFLVLGYFVLSAIGKFGNKKLIATIKEDLKKEGEDIENAPGSPPGKKDLKDTYKSFVDFTIKKNPTEKTSLEQLSKGSESLVNSAKKFFKK